ncbi:MAG: ABC transporter ATP-binding protein [Rhodospirillales bacterium]|nr:ABC transporter ATP-binding protein [Rhodospirillales bacterium]
MKLPHPPFDTATDAATPTPPASILPAPIAAVRCRGIIKDFETGDAAVRVLHGIDIDFNAGEMTLLVGPSGCGKTTLISIIAAILSATEGSVEVLGQPLAGMRGRDVVAFRRKNIGFIFQQYNLLPALNAAENASMPLVAAGMSLEAGARRAASVLERLGMGPHIHKLPRQLSGGQQQRVAIARALIHEPKLIVCDEPTAALDAASGLSVMTLMRAAALEPDRAVIVVTHDNRIFDFADRIAQMEDGRILHIETRLGAKENGAWH